MSQVVVFPVKDPAETKNYLFDFSSDLDRGESLMYATAVVNYVAGSGDTNNLATYLVGNTNIEGNSCVSQAFSQGYHLSTYDIRISATTSLGQVLVRIGRVPVITRT